MSIIKDFSFIRSADLNFPFMMKISECEIYPSFKSITWTKLTNGSMKDIQISANIHDGYMMIYPTIHARARVVYKNSVWIIETPFSLQFPITISQLNLESQVFITISIHQENSTLKFNGHCKIFNENMYLKEGQIPIELISEQISDHHTKENSHITLQFSNIPFPVVFDENELSPAIFPLKGQSNDVMYIIDEDMYKENLCESKARRLARSHTTGPLEKNLKPDAATRDLLHRIIGYPSTFELKASEKDIMWKFRYFLSKDKKALTKFLKCVTWSDSQERKQAIDLMRHWSRIDVEDIIELLGPVFQDKHVRHFAVSQLRNAEDQALLLYLLQLVQAIKFETINYEKIEQSSLVSFLYERSKENLFVRNYFYWYILIECESKNFGKVYARVAYHFMRVMSQLPQGTEIREMFARQGDLVGRLTSISSQLKEMRDNRTTKVAKLREFLSDVANGLVSFPPLVLPIDPSIQITGIVAEKCSVFNSVLSPLKLCFTCIDGSEYQLIFKNGDDLRQDQLVIQMITLMNKILQQENLDLKLTPYKVLATGNVQGMIQYVPSSPLAIILSEYGTIHSYFKHHHSDIETYIKSSAGYCVITYLLGVGDRHLDNLMLTAAGHLFHIDFSFILGRDPKPFPPPMKLCKEMVDVMNGEDGEYYKQFKSFCYIAFITLRKSASLILNLFALMTKAEIPDIQIEPDKAVFKIQEKFRLDLSEEEAIHYFETLIQDSVRALFPQMMEKIHSWAQYWRS